MELESWFCPVSFRGISMMMADHGAEVIKIESAEGKPTRGLGPRVGGETAYFRNTQRGKKSCVLDLQSKDSRLRTSG